MPGDHCIAMTTIGDERQAAALAREIVEARLAACVQIVAVRSVYRWQGSVSDESEQLLMIKTRSACYEQLEEFVRERHPYELPEIVRAPLETGSAAYLAWIDAETSAGG